MFSKLPKELNNLFSGFVLLVCGLTFLGLLISFFALFIWFRWLLIASVLLFGVLRMSYQLGKVYNENKPSGDLTEHVSKIDIRI